MSKKNCGPVQRSPAVLPPTGTPGAGDGPDVGENSNVYSVDRRCLSKELLASAVIGSTAAGLSVNPQEGNRSNVADVDPRIKRRNQAENVNSCVRPRCGLNCKLHSVNVHGSGRVLAEQRISVHGSGRVLAEQKKKSADSAVASIAQRKRFMVLAKCLPNKVVVLDEFLPNKVVVLAGGLPNKFMLIRNCLMKRLPS